jgi:transposase
MFPRLMMNIRVLATGGGHKTDPQDARAVALAALAALHHQGLHRVAAEDQDSVLGLLTQQRSALKSEPTSLLNRLRQLFRELLDGGVPTGLTLARARAAMKRVRPGTLADACRRDMANDLIALIARIEEQMKKYQDRMSDDALAAAGTTLIQIQGISTLLAAKNLGETAAVSRFPTAAHFASYAGASPRSSTAARAATTTPGNQRRQPPPHAGPDGHSSAGSATSSTGR